MLEGVLVLIVFLMAFLEVLDIGQLMFFEAMLGDRARAGARYAVVNTYDPVAIANVIAYNSPTAPGTTTGLFGLQPSMVTVNRYNAGLAGDRIEVIISNFPLAFVGPFLSASFTSRQFRVVLPAQSMGVTH
jgi:hypothetical protein